MLNHPIVNTKRVAIILAAEDYVPGSTSAHIYERAAAIAKAIDAPVLDFRPHNSLGDTRLRLDSLTQEISRLQRSTLIIAGQLLESAVTQIAIFSLLEGYDVYVCIDLIASEEPEHTMVFLNRIRDCAGQTLTSRQLVRELLTQATDNDSQDKLRSILLGMETKAKSVT